MSNIEVISEANNWLNKGYKVALATVLETWDLRQEEQDHS